MNVKKMLQMAALVGPLSMGTLVSKGWAQAWVYAGENDRYGLEVGGGYNFTFSKIGIIEVEFGGNSYEVELGLDVKPYPFKIVEKEVAHPLLSGKKQLAFVLVPDIRAAGGLRDEVDEGNYSEFIVSPQVMLALKNKGSFRGGTVQLPSNNPVNGMGIRAGAQAQLTTYNGDDKRAALGFTVGHEGRGELFKKGLSQKNLFLVTSSKSSLTYYPGKVGHDSLSGLHCQRENDLVFGTRTGKRRRGSVGLGIKMKNESNCKLKKSKSESNKFFGGQVVGSF